MHTIKERNAPDATTTVKKKQSLSMSDLDDIKSYVKTYVSITFFLKKSIFSYYMHSVISLCIFI